MIKGRIEIETCIFGLYLDYRINLAIYNTLYHTHSKQPEISLYNTIPCYGSENFENEEDYGDDDGDDEKSFEVGFRNFWIDYYL